MIKLRHLAAANAVAISLAIAAPPASAQWIVYDPTNFSQNVLTAARELQQITNQITMLNNQATIVQRQLNIQPTLTIRPGFPVRVIVTRDLVLAPYGKGGTP